MTDLLFSIILPVYNAQETLKPCVAGILAAAPRESELLLIDDGSTDGSGALCDQLAQADSRVRVHHQKNQGASSARNQGLSMARGRWVQFVDADDGLAPGLYEKALPMLQEGADVFFFGVRNQSGTVSEELPSGWFSGFSALPRPLDYYLVDTGLFASPINKLYSAAVLQGLRFDPALAINEDLLFNLQALQRCQRLYFCPESFYLCDDTRPGSLSRRLRTDILDAERYTRQAFLDFLSFCGLGEEEAEAVLRRRQQSNAVAQCAALLGRAGSLSFGTCRRLFREALAPAHQRQAVLQWAEGCYQGLALAIYRPCIRCRLAGALALLCRARRGGTA